jgi:hypothetical protein
MPIPPTICCTTCMTAANNGGRAADFSCEVCCVRNLMQMIEYMGEFGSAGHAERSKDLLAERLIGEA